MNIQQLLKQHSKSVTPDRLALAEWMDNKHLFTAPEVIQAFENVGRASVFRTLKLFSEIGYLRKIPLGANGESSYEVNHKHHHEHMQCDNCGEVLEFHSEDICQAILDRASQMGFQIREHALVLKGTCDTCQCS